MDKKINTIRTRPRFKLETDLSKEDFELNLKTKLQKNTEIQGNINKEVASIWVKTAHNEFWKPYLSLRAENEDEKPLSEELLAQVQLFGLFSCSYTLFSLLFSWFLSPFGLLQNKLTAKIFRGQFIFLSLHWFYYCLLFWPQKLVKEKQKPKWNNSKILQKIPFLNDRKTYALISF